MSDPINPSHYTDLKPEPIDVIAAWRLNYDRGCAVKYVARAGRKAGADEIEDLEKAIRYLQHEVTVLLMAQKRALPPVQDDC